MTENAAGVAGQELDQGTEDLLEALRDVVDPELGVNVVDLGLVYGVTVGEDRVATIDMTLTSAACPLTDVIEDQTAAALEGLVSDFRLNWVWLPPRRPPAPGTRPGKMVDRAIRHRATAASGRQLRRRARSPFLRLPRRDPIALIPS